LSDPVAARLYIGALRHNRVIGEMALDDARINQKRDSFDGRIGGAESGFSAGDCEAIPKIFLHSTYTGQNGLFFSLFFRCFDKSENLERVRGIEPLTFSLGS
jgi:hypothetical protein